MISSSTQVLFTVCNLSVQEMKLTNLESVLVNDLIKEHYDWVILYLATQKFAL